MWTTVDIAGKPADVFASPENARPRLGLLFLHDVGLETLAVSPAYTGLLEKHRLPRACAHGKRSWWADKICREFDPVFSAEKHLVHDVLPFFRERFGLKP